MGTVETEAMVARSSDEQTLNSEQKRRYLISFFFFFHCLAVFVTLLPKGSADPILKSALSLFSQYRVFTATHQEWNMFAPEPERFSKLITVKAVVAWKDEKPVYSPVPLYTSYYGNIDEFFSENSLAYHKGAALVRRMLNPRWRNTVQYFGFYWAEQVRKWPQRPVAVQVILTEEVPGNNRLPATELKEKILFEVPIPTSF